MKVSLNWVRFLNQQYQCAADPAPDGIDKLVEKIGAQLGAVEEVIDLGKKYEGIVIVKVISAEKHPNADKLSLCMIDAGKPDPVQVVCGAPNVKAGQRAVWIPPGVTVPATVDKEPFVLESREIRGIISNGMLASPKELALGDGHEGILILGEGKPGDDFAKSAGLDDCVIDIENKMFTHRPDLFGQLGIARELAGIQQQVFKSPDWYKEDADIHTDGRSNGLKLEVKNEVPKLVRRFCAIAIKDIKVGPSPIWLQVRLSAVGIRPINNIVDITNFLMMETAQPLHAYDYDKVKTGFVGVRMAENGETLKLLGGREVKLDEESVVITDGDKPIGLGGVMGGADAEVDETTKNIILEVANFDTNQTRKTAMRYGLFTDAATRFTKNQSPRQNRAVIVKAVDDILRLAGGRVSSQIIDVKSGEIHENTVKSDINFVNSRLGLSLSGDEIKKLLENVEFVVTVSGDSVSATAPFWRTDIEIPEDIVEEVGRLYGYDKLPVVLPSRDLSPAPENPLIAFKTRLRGIMRRAGANEVLTYSFVPERLLKAAGQDPKETYHIRNALSPDLQYYRLNLLPSLLEKTRPNVKNGYDSFMLFEIGRGHNKNLLDEPGLPAGIELLAGVSVNPYAKGAPYYQAYQIADYLLAELNITDITLTPLKEADLKMKSSMLNCYEPSRTSLLWGGDRPLGLIGEPSQELRAALKLPAATSMFELEIPNLFDTAQPESYRPLNKFPELSEDICLKLPAELPYADADELVWDELRKIGSKHGYIGEIATLDIFQREDDKTHKQITWRITMAHPDRTLTKTEANKVLDEIARAAKKEFNAERI
jgi:phenylalanyl-tRNA synthetase beta chain